MATQRERNRQRLRWAVEFAGLDLAHLRPGDRLNLHDETYRFLGFEPEGGSDPAEAGFMTIPTQDPTEADMGKLQAEVLRLLDWAASHPDLRQGGDLPEFEITSRWRVVPIPGGPMSLMAAGDVRNLFLTRLIFLLAQEGFDNLQRCPEYEHPECKRLFWKVGRKRYCSRQCTNRAVFRAWSKDPKKKKARSRREVKRQQAERRRHDEAMAAIKTAKRGGRK